MKRVSVGPVKWVEMSEETMVCTASLPEAWNPEDTRVVFVLDDSGRKRMWVGVRLCAMVDDEDYERVKGFKWNLSSQGYAIRGARAGEPRGNIMLHHQIMGGDGSQSVAFMNGNRLDCRKANLRLATQSQISGKTGLSGRNTSGYRGVSWSKQAKKWLAKIGCKGVVYPLGRFDDKHEAGEAYNRAAVHHFGEFAYQNIIERG